MLGKREAEHVFEQLRKGLVPASGLDTFAVGVERQRAELQRQFELVEKNGTGSIKFLRGGYGCGKTFMARLAILDAQRRNFVTSFVVVSDNEMNFYRFEEVYRKVVAELGTQSCPRGALSDILDRWIGRIEEGLIASKVDPDAPDFDDKVRAKLDEELANLTGGNAPPDFVRVVQTIFELKQEGDLKGATQLLSWLSGSTKIDASAKKRAGIKGEIGSLDALGYLRGVLEIAKSAGYAGMLIVIDEAETILRMRTDSRHKSLNGIRQISDASGEYPGLLWLFTGTPEFFDGRRGVAGLAPLHERILFKEQNGFASLRQPQLLLKPFDATRLKSVAVRLRDLYPSEQASRIAEKVDDPFIDQLVARVTAGFKGDVGVVPRQFLREFVDVLDLVEQEAHYDPRQVYQFEAKTLSPEEAAVQTGTQPPPADDEAEFIPAEEVW